MVRFGREFFQKFKQNPDITLQIAVECQQLVNLKPDSQMVQQSIPFCEFESTPFCDTMLSNSFPFVLAPLRRSLCLFWGEIHTKGRDLPRDRKWRREARSERRHKEQLTKQGRREQSV